MSRLPYEPAESLGGRATVTRYRITPWPIRVLIPLMALILIVGILHDHSAPFVSIPAVLVAAVAWLYQAERGGLYCSATGVESKMTRRGNSFRYGWSEIDRFEVTEAGAQVVIVVALRDGSQRMLPSTKAWRYQRRAVTDICEQLNRSAKD